MESPERAPTSIRPATLDDARSILEVHRSAVLRTAARQYAPDVLSAWAAPLDPGNVERMAGIITSNSELILVAEIHEQIVGFGSIVPKNSELRAVYVHPDYGRGGIGGRLLAALEALARQRRLSELTMDASLNAEDFYANRGFVALERGEHALRTGVRMPCVKMRKALDLP
jgi:putative acetyltransferase